METIQNEAKDERERFLSLLLGALGAGLLGNMLADKGVIRVGYGSKGKKYIRAGYGPKNLRFKKSLIPPYPSLILTKFYQNEPSLMEFILEIIYLIK